MRKEHTLDSPDEIVVQPWPSRSFPLSDQELEILHSSQTASQRSDSTQNTSSERWKVISTDEEHSKNNKNSLVLKFTKT